MSWDLVVIVGGTDVSDDLVNVGAIVVEIERSAARTAEFTLLLQGTVNLLAWTGKTVTIDYVSGSNTRLFNGVIVEPTLNIQDMTLHCRCSDDLQRVADATLDADLLTLTGGRWSKYVFDTASHGWDRLQDILTTVSKSVWLNNAGALQCASLQVDAVSDYTFTANEILDDSLSVQLVQRGNLINRVDIAFSGRFERLYHREEELIWTWPKTFCETYPYQPKAMTKAIAQAALAATGWQLLAENYTAYWSTGNYSCPSEGFPTILFSNSAPDALINGFALTAAFRWQQSITDEFAISVTAPASITAYGELKQSLEANADFVASVADWTDQETDYSVVPSGFAYETGGNQFRDEINGTALANALDTIIAVAVERINASHRSNTVTFDLAMFPALGLQHTVSINDGNVQAKGIVNRIIHTLDIGSARAVTQVELLLSSGQSGQEIVTPTWTTPAHPDNAAGSTPPPNQTNVPTYIGRSWSAVPFNSTLWGWFINYLTPELIATVPPDPIIVYDEKLILKFDAVSDTKTQHKSDAVNASITLSVPHNLLTITA